MERLLYVRARLFEDQVLPALPLNTMPRATRHGCVGIRGSFYCPMLLESPPHGALPFSARATGKTPAIYESPLFTGGLERWIDMSVLRGEPLANNRASTWVAAWR